MRSGSWRTAVAGILLAVSVPWCTGCATGFYLEAGGNSGAGVGAVEVRVFDSRADLQRGATSTKGAITELYSRDSRSKEPIRREKAGQWTASDIPPGRYDLRVWRTGETDRDGNQLRPPHKALVVVAGQTTVATVVLIDSRKSWRNAALGTLAVIGITYGILYLSGWSPMAGFSLGPM